MLVTQQRKLKVMSNSKKRILIISRSFYPIISPRSFRATELAKEFSRLGHDVTVITHKDEIQTEFAKAHRISIKDLGKRKLNALKLGSSQLLINLSRILNRLLQITFEYPDVELMYKVYKSLEGEKDFDLLISIAVPYPIHWGVALKGKKIKEITKCWIADCGDPYMGCKTDTFRRFFYFRYVEKWMFQKTDFITITKYEFINNYFKEFHYKINEVPQGFNFEEVKLAEYQNSSYPVFGFAGNLIKNVRDPSVFLDYLTTNHKNFKFILYTKSVHLIRPYQLALGEKIEIRDYVPRLELLYELSKMNFVVNFEFNPLVQSPSKLIDYGIIGRPILNVNSEDFNPNTFDEFLEGNYSNRFIIPDIDKYRIENVCNSFLTLLEKATHDVS